MEKLSAPEDDDGAIHSVETYILERIFADRKSEDSTTDISDLMGSIDSKMSPLFDQGYRRLDISRPYSVYQMAKTIKLLLMELMN